MVVEKVSDTGVRGGSNLAPALSLEHRCLTPQFGGVFEGQVPGGPGDDYLNVLEKDGVLLDPVLALLARRQPRPVVGRRRGGYETAPGPEGRRRELAFAGDVPDPENPQTFERLKLWREERPGLRELYADPVRLPCTLPRDVTAHADEDARIVKIRRGEVELAADFENRTVEIKR
jgi:hypothetical protein